MVLVGSSGRILLCIEDSERIQILIAVQNGLHLKRRVCDRGYT